MRRAAVSIPSNIVEGNARRTTADYLRFLYIALGSACELRYLTELSEELELVSGDAWPQLKEQCAAVVRQLESLIQRLEALQGPPSRRLLSQPVAVRSP